MKSKNARRKWWNKLSPDKQSAYIEKIMVRKAELRAKRADMPIEEAKKDFRGLLVKSAFCYKCSHAVKIRLKTNRNGDYLSGVCPRCGKDIIIGYFNYKSRIWDTMATNMTFDRLNFS